MADSVIQDEIITVLRERGPVTVQTHGEFRHEADIHGSSHAVKQAVGSLIRDGVVRRTRRHPGGCSDFGTRPITFAYVESSV